MTLVMSSPLRGQLGLKSANVHLLRWRIRAVQNLTDRPFVEFQRLVSRDLFRHRGVIGPPFLSVKEPMRLGVDSLYFEF